MNTERKSRKDLISAMAYAVESLSTQALCDTQGAIKKLLECDDRIWSELDDGTIEIPSARVAAEEIASYLFATIFHPSGQGGISESQEAQIAAIISRHFPVQPVEEHRWKSISGVLENHPLRDEYAATIGAATADNDGEFAFDQSCYYCRNKCCHSAQAHAAAVSEHC